MKLWKLIQKEKKDKKQISGKLNDGACGYCIDGLIIKALNPEINITYEEYDPVTQFIAKHPDKFDYKYIDNDGSEDIEYLVEKLKEHYRKTGKINMTQLYQINDISFEKNKPFTFLKFQKLFKEMDVEI